MASFEQFKVEAKRLSDKFIQNLPYFRGEHFNESLLRIEYLDPLLTALGWDLQNRQNRPQQLRDVEIERRVDIVARKKRADYIFRTNGLERFVCEAKKPQEPLVPKYAYQAQRYAFNLQVRVAVLTNFENLQVFILGGKPDPDEPWAVCKQWHVSEFASKAKEIWDLFSTEQVALNSLETFIASLPKRVVRGVARQGWLIPKDRIRAVDEDFLDYFEGKRAELARDLVANNPGYAWEDAELNEAVQRILNRILFVRICEDRDIDTGRLLVNQLEDWKETNPRPPLYRVLVKHFHSLDSTFNGSLFKRGHFSETLQVSDHFVHEFIQELSAEDSEYLFNTIRIEILGSVYERFIGREVKQGKDGRVEVRLKPEIRKANGVYYTPRYVVNHIVESTVGALLGDKSPAEVSRMRVLDPACGSGSFLLRVFERICEHYLEWFKGHPRSYKRTDCYKDQSGTLHLTSHLKQKILLNNVYGVDQDSQAVEITMLGLYLKMLEGETRTTLGQQQTLYEREEKYLPDLSNNVKCGNSLVDNDILEDLRDGREGVEELASFDWESQFPFMRRSQGFDAVVGNPPYIDSEWMTKTNPWLREYCTRHYEAASGNWDIFCVFIERSLDLCRPGGRSSMIVPNKLLAADYAQGVRKYVSGKHTVISIRDYSSVPVFPVSVYPIIYVCLAKKLKEVPLHIEVMHETSSTPEVSSVHDTEARRLRELGGQEWSVLVENHSTDLLGKIEQGRVPLDDLATVSGAATVGEAYEYKELISEADDVTGEYFKLVNTGTIDPYAICWGYYPTKYLKSTYQKPVVSARRSNKLSARRLAQANAQKLIVAGMSKKLECAIDYEKCLAGKSTTIVYKSSLDLRYLAAILNSQMMSYYYARTFGGLTLQGGYFRVGTPQLKRLPIHVPTSADSTRLARIIRLVGSITKLSESLLKAKSEGRKKELSRKVWLIEQAIERQICELYGLSAKEIGEITAFFS